MSIVAACPHCESRFHLQPDLVGKAMRCPNPNCREPFVVEEAKPKVKKAEARASEKSAQTSGSVGEVVPVIEASAATPRKPTPAKPRPKPTKTSTPAPDLPPLFDEPDEAEVVEAEVVESKLAPPPSISSASTKPSFREVVWSPDADAPGSPISRLKSNRAETERKPEPVYEPEPEEEEVEFVRKRKKKKNRAPMILIGMCIAVVLTVGVIIASLVQRKQDSEEKDSAEAQKQYADAKYEPAAKLYRSLAENYPANAEKYRFFADLAEMRKNVALVTSFEEPRKALDSMRGFIEKHKASPLAKPDPYGQDVFAAGRQLLEDVKKNADGHVQAFMADRRTKADELKKADDILALGLDFVPLLKDFRAKDDPHSLDSLREPLKEVQVAIGKQRKRLDILAQGRALVGTPTDQAIQDAKSLFSSNGYDDDETQEIIRNAEANFLKAIRFEREPANPQAPPAPAAKSLLFVAPVGTTRPAVRGLDDHPTVFLAIARGVLYALDEDDGKLLWAARVGPDVFDPPTIAQVQLAEGPTDLALVTSNVAGHPAITAYALRSGQPKWSQPLTPKTGAGVDEDKLPPSPAAGAAAVIGSRAYVSVRDAAGSVLVFDIATGTKIGRITIGQTISPGAIARPGTAQLYVAAESRRLFVFDVEAVASGGEPQCVRVIPTDHPTGSLRTIPIILGQPGDDPSPRFLVLSQSDGKRMKIRAFPLPPTPSIAPDAPPLLEPLGTPVELSLNGWAWFPPVSDSERLTVVTDRNQFRIFGINQPGNEDAALFPLPFPTIPEPPRDEAIRGLVVPAEEGAYWVLIGGSLKKFRLTLLPDRGLTLVPVGVGLPIGVPTQPAQLNIRRDTACFVVTSANSSGSRAVAVKLTDGAPRWQRQLGIIPSAAPVSTAKGLLLVDGDGGAITVPAAGASLPSATTSAPPEWIAAPPIDGITTPTQVIPSPDGKTIFTIASVGEGEIAKWIIRRAVNGKFDRESVVKAKGEIAGRPAFFNGSLLIPAADGFIYRLVMAQRVDEDTLVAGPKWLLSRNVENPECFIVPIANETFLTSDGGKILKRWNWPAGGTYLDDNASWNVRQRIASAPLVLATAGKPARMLVADVTGGIWLYGLDRGDPIRRWIPGKTLALPPGKVSPRFAEQHDASGRQLAAYTVNAKKLVCLDVDADEPRWIASMKDDAASNLVGSPLAFGMGRWLVTDLGGRVSILNAENGQPELTREIGLPGAVPETIGMPIGENLVLVPLNDGSAAIVNLAPEPKTKE